MRIADEAGRLPTPTALCATNQRDKLSLQVELVGASINRDRALLDLIEASRHAAQQHCPVCSAPVIGGDANAGQASAASSTRPPSGSSPKTSSAITNWP